MNNNEYNEQDFLWIMERGTYGHVAFHAADGYPRAVPVNYVYLNNSIYFHGATDGEKYDAFETKPNVGFSLVIPYSQIPSYWKSDDYACSASMLFKSVFIKGTGKIVNDLQEKITGLDAMMKKYQPEGGYQKFDVSESMYKTALSNVAVMRIDPLHISIKVKMGQQFDDYKLRQLIERLEERNSEIDKRTVEEIRKLMQKGQLL